MSSFLKFFEGKKTYFASAAGAIVVGLVFGGILTEEQATPILAFLGFAGIAGLRAAK